MITVLINGRLLDCVGEEPLEGVNVIAEDGLIKDILLIATPPPDSARIVDVRGLTILPGLTDAHHHPAAQFIDLQEVFTRPTIVTAIKIKNGLERTLQAGFTTVADMGFGNYNLKMAIEKGWIKGPRLLLACSALSKTGGHADFVVRGDPTLTPMKDTGLIALPRLCDGVEDCLKAVREQFRVGADHIKVMATGGGATPNDSIWDSGFNEAELSAICDEARDMGRRVAAHTLNDPGIRRAVRCGVNSIDHGMFMSEESALMMKEADVYHVPTITVLHMLKKHGREWGMADYLDKKTTDNDLLGESFRCTELTHRLGVRLGSASDAWAEICGMEGHEIMFKTECGLTPYEAIKSATVVNAELFGLKDKIGTVEPGKWADLIVVEGRPEENAKLFCDPANVRVVMKGGTIFKNTL